MGDCWKHMSYFLNSIRRVTSLAEIQFAHPLASGIYHHAEIAIWFLNRIASSKSRRLYSVIDFVYDRYRFVSSRMCTSPPPSIPNRETDIPPPYYQVVGNHSHILMGSEWVSPRTHRRTLNQTIGLVYCLFQYSSYVAPTAQQFQT